MKWERLIEVQGRLEAELIESLLEANGVDVELIQESIGHSAFPLHGGWLGRVRFYSQRKSPGAHDLLRAYNDGSNQEE